MRICICSILLISAISTAPVAAQVSIPSANLGTDGALVTTTSNLILDLEAAVLGNWEQPGTGTGVYDPVMHAVVYKFSSIDIAAGTQVSFTFQDRNAPVVFLVSGDANVAGTINLNGEWGTTAPGTVARPGPGGYRGGRATVPPSVGQGPGGADGSHATGANPYGNDFLVPLTGGSGTGGTQNPFGGGPGGGGAGGGAILIASEGTLTVDGLITADGGRGVPVGVSSSSGGGGGIRLVANQILGSGVLRATKPAGTTFGNNGRIRLEVSGGAPSPILVASSIPIPIQAGAATPTLLWPPSDQASVRIDSVGGVAIPADPKANLTPDQVDAFFASSGPTEFLITTFNLDPSQSVVTVRIAFETGGQISVNATNTGGTTAQATWSASATLDDSKPASVTVHAKP